MFSASARNCALITSVMENVLNREASKLICPGPRSEITRPTLPKVNCGACENAAGFIQPSRRLANELSTSAGTPVALGRCVLAPITLLLFGCEMASGYPDCKTPVRLALQPEAATFKILLCTWSGSR